MGSDLGGHRRQAPGGELPQALPGCAQVTDAGGQFAVDVAQRLKEEDSTDRCSGGLRGRFGAP